MGASDLVMSSVIVDIQYPLIIAKPGISSELVVIEGAGMGQAGGRGLIYMYNYTNRGKC